MNDIILTWPRDRPLQSYLDELVKAENDGLVINFRVAHPPRDAIVSGNQVSVSFRGVQRLPKCYMVHDGYVRGYLEVLEVAYKGSGIVHDTQGDPNRYPAGWYIVRHPKWHPIDPVPMRGFQGFRYASEDWLEIEANKRGNRR